MRVILSISISVSLGRSCVDRHGVHMAQHRYEENLILVDGVSAATVVVRCCGTSIHLVDHEPEFRDGRISVDGDDEVV